MDIRAISLELFGDDVIVKLKEGTVVHNIIGGEIKGKLIRRVWGEKTILNNNSKEEKINTVIAIAILRDGEEIEVSSDEIDVILG